MTNKVRGSVIDLPQAASAAPTTGSHTLGEIVYSNLATGPIGWKCVASGTPGTWMPFGEAIIDVTTAWDPPSLVAAGKVDVVLGVSGAALGDFVIASFDLDVTGCTLSSAVSAANTVTVTLVNVSGASINIGSGNLSVRVYKK